MYFRPPQYGPSCAIIISFHEAYICVPFTDLLRTHRLLLVTVVEIMMWALGLSLQFAAACSDLDCSCC